ncbi:SDR family oxidoreductase [Desertibaculum subflavum]|uniref:SDR family oxidoreductase n=1 Tax=Desertibaculum subflavum TaxID=2268458 RepID=UPI000E6730CF
MFQAGLLAGKRILITGGGTGLGKSIGRRYAELGAELVICGRRLEVLEATAAEIHKEYGAKVTPISCDVRDPEAVEAMLDRIWADRALDVLVNNAAGNFIAQTHKLSHRAIDSVLGIVLHGAAYCTIGCGRRWIEEGQPGTVLNILTLSALTGAPFTVPSAMAKAGLVAMIKSLAVEWGPKGIRLVGVAPGPFPTEGAWSRLRPEGAGRKPAEAAIPLGRVGRHEELADLCAYLVSDKAGFITGEIIAIDGGKQHTGGGGVGTTEMLSWTDADWDRIRPAKKNS